MAPSLLRALRRASAASARNRGYRQGV